MNLYFFFSPSKKKKFLNEINFINEADVINPFSFVFPYPFVSAYDYKLIRVNKDDKKDLFYVIHKGKRLYYSRDFTSESAVMHSYNSISIEQDEKSPHCYLNNGFTVEENDVVMDIGSAEGNFSLDIIEKVKTLYIIESDKNWIEALNATFEPWKEKVNIINKFVSDVDNDTCTTLESVLEDHPVNFIKMDVEGAEVQILKSSYKIFNRNPSLKMAICTYHRNNDAKKIEKILSETKFNYSFSNGYMVFIFRKLTPPYFRRGLIKAYKMR